MRWVGLVGLALALALGIDLAQRLLASDRVQWQAWEATTTELTPVGHTPGPAADQPRRLVRFTADWCPPCRAMEKSVFSRRDVADAIHARFRPVEVDLTAPTPRQASIAQRYGVATIPTLLVLDDRGRELGRLDAATDAETFLDWLNRH
ncbi:MAG: thioredoxin fold domain-containing protein [Planctomycetota bacterium]